MGPDSTISRQSSADKRNSELQHSSQQKIARNSESGNRTDGAVNSDTEWLTLTDGAPTPALAVARGRGAGGTAALTFAECKSGSSWHNLNKNDFGSRHNVVLVVKNLVPPTFSSTQAGGFDSSWPFSSIVSGGHLPFATFVFDAIFVGRHKCCHLLSFLTTRWQVLLTAWWRLYVYGRPLFKINRVTRKQNIRKNVNNHHQKIVLMKNLCESWTCCNGNGRGLSCKFITVWTMVTG